MQIHKTEGISLPDNDLDAIKFISEYLRHNLSGSTKVISMNITSEITKLNPVVSGQIISALAGMCDLIAFTTNGIKFGDLGYFRTFLGSISADAFNKLIVNIRLDGARVVHNENNGGDTYFDTYKALVHFLKSGMQVNVECYITNNTMKHLNEMVDWLNFVKLVWLVEPKFYCIKHLVNDWISFCNDGNFKPNIEVIE
jgi:hypothetical protein